jgi:hypothetical protein
LGSGVLVTRRYLGEPKAAVNVAVVAAVVGEAHQASTPWTTPSCLSVEVVEAADRELKAQAVAMAVAPGSTAVVRPGSRAKRSWTEHLEEEVAAGRSQAAAPVAKV